MPRGKKKIERGNTSSESIMIHVIHLQCRQMKRNFKNGLKM